jgi:molybdenum cofactor cytidylyltransferase
MPDMDLRTALRFGSKSRIAFVGSGGKTTAMFWLAHQVKQPVIVTTTTHLGDWQICLADRHFVVDPNDDQWLIDIRNLNSGVVLLTGALQSDNRYSGVDAKSLDLIRQEADSRDWAILIECDGSRQKPIKAPAEHEPLIPDFVNQVVSVSGLSGLHRPLSQEWCHRPQLTAELLDVDQNILITKELLLTLLTHKNGGLKNIPIGCERTVLLNQIDTVENQVELAWLSEQLIHSYHRVVAAALKSREIAFVEEKIAGVVLAAGASSRFGAPKPLLMWNGIPFVRQVALTALNAGLSPVIVVLGAYDTQIRSALEDLDLIIVHNNEWQLGQSTSVRLGVRFAKLYNCGGACFLLVDQPHVTSNLITGLIDRHSQTMAAITAPKIAGRQGNPVLFDRRLFDDLLLLQGDTGGRLLFSSYPVDQLDWDDPAMDIDVDTTADYHRLQSIYSKH